MLGIIFSFVAYTCFAVMDLINKFIGHVGQMPLLSHLFWFMLVYTSTYFLLGTMRHTVKDLFATDVLKYIMLRALLLVIGTVCLIYILPKVTLVAFYTIVALQPMIVSSIAIILGFEKLSWRKIWVILVGFSGVLVYLQVWSTQFYISDLVNLLIVVNIVLVGGLSGLVSKRYLYGESTFTLGVYHGLLALFLIFGTLLITGSTLVIPHFSNLLIVPAGIFAAIGSYCFAKSYQIESKVQAISQMQYIQIVWGALFGMLFFGDVVILVELVGILIIIGAGIINVYKPN